MNEGKYFFFGLGIGLFLTVMVWSSMSDSRYEEVQGVQTDSDENIAGLEIEIGALKDEAAKKDDCISFLKEKIEDMNSSNDSIRDTIEPFVNGEPTYDEAYDMLRNVDYYLYSDSSVDFFCN